MIIKKRSLGQNLLIIGASILVFILFFVLFYLPRQQKIRHLKEKNRAIREDIQKIVKKKEPNVSLGQFMVSVKEKQKQLSDQFPRSEGEVIREISNLILSSGLDLVSIKSFLQPLNKKEEKIFSALKDPVKKLRLRLIVKGYFFQLVSFLELLDEKIILFHNIEKLSIHKQKDRLRIKVNGGFFFLAEND